jgi:short-subunit dehydrogenase
MGSLEKYTLITGASEGLGLELAKLFAMDKHNLIIVARNSDKLNEAKVKLQGEYKIIVKTLAVDLSVDNACEEIYKFVDEKNLVVDNLINNAGIGSFGFFSEEDQQFHNEIININIKSLTNLTSHFLKDMIQRKDGKILNVASTAAFTAGPKMAMYYATKAYVLSLSEALHEEGKDYGVTVSCLCPGPVKTSFQKKAGIKKADSAKKYLMEADKVAEIAYKDFKKGKAIIIPGLKNKILIIGNKLISRSIGRKIILNNNKG